MNCEWRNEAATLETWIAASFVIVIGEMARVPRWTIRDVLDLEASFEADVTRDPADLARRDRAIFHDDIAGVAHDAPGKVRLWLEARRRDATGAPRAGDAYAGAMGAVTWGLIILGLLAGSGLAGSLLVFSGERPISAAVFFSTTVLWQIFVWMVVVIFWCFGGGVRGLAAAGISRLVAFLAERMDGTRQAKFAAVWGTVRAKRTIYGDVLLWPVATLTQLFAVALNVGILATTLWQVAIANKAFGWETTLNLLPTTALRIVEIISLPWSWLPHPHPTIAEIEGSRIAFFGQSEYLQTAAASWWPFLCYAVLFYGLLPRVILLVTSVALQRRALAAVDFRHAECARLLRRMDPVVVSGAEGEKISSGVAGETGQIAAAGGEVGIVLESREMTAEKRDGLVNRLGWSGSERIPVEVDCAEDNAAEFARIADESRAVAVLIDGTRPPVKAILEFLRQLRGTLTERAEVMVVIVAEDGQPFDYAETWSAAVAGLGDPFMRVEKA